MKASLADRIREHLAAIIPGTSTNAARRLYYDLEAQVIALYRELDSTSPTAYTERARLLTRLSNIDATQARALANGWTTHPEDAENAQAREDSAELHRLIGATEAAKDAYSRAHANPTWEAAFGTVLDALAGERDLFRRAGLMTRLHILSVPVVGENAAETITRVRDAYAHTLITMGTEERSAS